MDYKDLDKSKIPQHVAIIMDGNGRWAKKKGMPRTFGHKSAINSVKSAIQVCNDLKIPYLTLFAFSSENWNRPIEEVSTLMQLLVNSLKNELNNLIKNNIRLKTIGDIEKLPENVKKELKDVIIKTKDNNNGTLILALNYGSKQEIVNATKKISQAILNNEFSLNEIDKSVFERYLYTKDIPDVDLLIRTSGENRISNFLLWQIAYAELYFTTVYWPDFNEQEFYKAIKYYQLRERRFGKTSEQLLKGV